MAYPIDKDVRDLEQQIELAFADAERPKDEHIVYDNSGFHLECNEVAESFRGKSWKVIPLDVLRYHAQALFFFSPAGYRYYLPAYLIATLIHYDDVDTIPGSVISSLIPPNDSISRNAYHARIDGLTSPQRAAIKAWLLFLKDRSPDDDPLGYIDQALLQL